MKARAQFSLWAERTARNAHQRGEAAPIQERGFILNKPLFSGFAEVPSSTSWEDWPDYSPGLMNFSSRRLPRRQGQGTSAPPTKFSKAELLG